MGSKPHAFEFNLVQKRHDEFAEVPGIDPDEFVSG